MGAFTFEDNAEFAYGFYLAQDAIRKELLIRLENLKNAGSRTGGYR